MTAFDFATAQRIKFGPGSVRQLGVLVGGYGRRVALVTGGASLAVGGRLAEIEEQFRAAKIDWLPVQVTGEPTVELVDRLTAGLVPYAPEAIVAIGGGSVLDTGKALAALLANGGTVLDYLEGVGRGGTLTRPSLPFIAVPTTAGTGSEVTRNAVIGDEARTFKKSMRSAFMLPSLALVDPDLTADCPPAIRAACGMDAITQLIEAYTSQRSGPMTDSLALQGLGHAAEFPFLIANPTDAEAREALSLASLLGGICLANAGLGAVHGLASPLGAYFPIPHGVACAAVLAPVLRQNIIRALEQDQKILIYKYSTIFDVLVGATSLDDLPDDEDDRDDDSPAVDAVALGEPVDPEKWAESGEAEELDEDAENEQIDLAIAADNGMHLVQYLTDLHQALKLPGLSRFGIGRADFDRIIAGSGGTSMQTNLVKLDDADLTEILESAL
jgi:alcohol dehydrogenase class IV